MKLFRPANPDLRRPAWLQSHTKENIIWQLLMVIPVCAGITAWGEYQDRKYMRDYRKTHPQSTIY